LLLINLGGWKHTHVTLLLHCIPISSDHATRYNDFMNPAPELINAIYAEKVQRARRSPVAYKLSVGPALFEFACEAARAGIRAQFPDASSEEVEEHLRNRLHLAARLEEHTWTQTA
jgi:hypothetical protein